ncbi:centromere-associated protein E-like isoform X1 [Eleutherodactylus coqui]|uniref:centromere-associated protein E-like isoform X1 n=1 Tax=Eleutherodactylus coqui TaxID=57060 RepID=UPI003462386F
MAEGDAVKVCVRVRPLIHREQGEQVNVLWQANNNVISQVDGSRSFTFDRVFPLHETTAEVYRDAAVPIIRSVLQGYNGTIFAYGQTSSGKTFTMMGTKDNPGIISLAIQEVFRIIQEDPTREFLLRVSYMEIYNETVTDLLCDDRRRKPLDVREDINRNVYVADLTDELVMTPEHVMQWIKRGEKNRHYGETKMNDRSSRSHAIFRMIIESRERIESGNAENCDGAVMVSHLNLVDLAGSERASQTAAEGVRLKEGCNINRSLFVLGQVIKKLSDGQVGGFINYRDSKLTRILQNSFGGNTKTVVICTVTPVSLDETLSTLQFASTAKHVRNTPHVNEVLDDQALLKRYQKQILDLKKQVENASSEIRAQAMAKEEHSQLLAEIKQLLKEKEDRIWNLSNVVIGSSQQAREDQRVKLKRRVTWAPGKIQASLCSAGDSSFQMGSTLTMSFAKRPKMSEPLSIPEIDDSICAETSVFEGAGCALDNSAQDPTWNFESGVTSREKMTALSHSMIDFSSESTSALTKDSSLQKCKELEQKVAELEEELKRRNEEYEAVVRKRDCLVNVTADLEEKLHSEDKDELQITSLSDRSESVPDGNEQNPMPEGSLEMPGKLSPLKTDEQELEKLNDSPLSNRTDGVDQDPVLGLLASPIHDLCREQIQMLEQKIADLEGNESPVNNDQTYLMESLQICDALMAEKLNAHEELADMQNNFDHLVNENESLKREMADLEKRLQEKQETNEFEMLEKETREEHEAQLIHEISNIKKLMQNAEVINQELENELDTKSKVLKEQEQIMAQLKRENEMLQKKVRSMDLLASMEDCDKLCDEVLQLKQSLSDAEAVTRDAQREAAFLRSENLELKEKMDELVIHCEKREKDASGYEKQLESEKSNAKRMQADLQKELQYAFNELNKLNGLLAGKVPKELLSHVELDKKVADYSKQLNELLEEKKTMEQEIASLLEYKSLPGEIENLKDQLFRLQEEALQNATVHEELLQKTEELEQGQISQKEEISNLMKTVMEAESTLESWQNEKRETEQLLTTLQQQMDEITGERDELRATKESLTLEMASLKDVEAELLSLRNEKLNLEEKLFSLQQHIDMMTSERDELKATLQSLVSERDQLKEDLRENVEMSIETQDDLRQALHDLQQQRQRVEELTSQIASLEQKSSRMQEELQRCQEELQQQIILVNNLRMEDSITSSKEKEATDFIPSLEEKVLSLQDKFLETNAEYEQLAQNKEKLEQEKNLLSCQIEGLTKDMKETQSSLESLLNEKLEAQRQLLDLQQQMETLQEQNHLKDAQQKSISAIDQGSQASHFENYLEQKTIKCSCKDLVQSNLTINDDLELESMNLNNSEADDEKKINQLGVELVTEELKNLKAAQQLLESERDQLKEQLEKNIEKLSRLQEEGLQNANVHEELLQKTEELEQGQISQKEEISNLMKTVMEAESTLESLQNEKRETEQLLTTLQQQMNEITGERDELRATKESLILDMASLTNMQTNRQRIPENEDSMQAQPMCSHMLHGNFQDVEAELLSLRNEKLNLEEKLFSLQQHTDMMTSERDEMKATLSRLQEEALQNANVHQELLQKTEELEQGQISQKEEISNLMKTVMEAESTLESLQNEKRETEQLLTTLQQQMDEITGERDELRATKESLTLEMVSLKNMETNQQRIPENEDSMQAQPMCSHMLDENCQDVEAELLSLRNEKLNLEEKLFSLQQHTDMMTSERDELKATLSHLQEEALQNATVHQELLQKNEELEQGQISQKEEISNLMKTVMEAESTLESLQNKKRETEQLLTTLQQQMDEITGERDELKATKESLTLEMASLKDMEAELCSLCHEKLNLEEKLFSLQQHIDKMTSESDELKTTLQSLVSERDQMKEDLRENVEMSIETQDHLREAQHDLQQQKLSIEELTCQIASLEQKSSILNHELQETIAVLKESNNERDLLEQMKQKLVLELEHLHNDIKNKELTIGESEKERTEAEQKVLALTVQLKSMSEEREELQKQSAETEEELKRTQEELDQQKQGVEKLANEISLLEEKSSELERELQEKSHILNKAVEDRHIFDQSKQGLVSEMEQVMEDLKNKDSDLKQAEKEKEAVSQKILELTNKMQSIAQERDDLVHSKKKLEEEAEKLREEFQQLKHEHNLLADQQTRKTSQIDELETELQQMQEKMRLSDTSIKQLGNEKVALQKQLQQCELKVASLHQEQEQMQQLLERVRSEKQTIYASLQDQEKAVAQLQDELITSQTKLETVKEECNERNAQLAEKVNEVTELLKEKASVEEENEQWVVKVSDEMVKNWKLEEKISFLESLVTLLRSTRNETSEEVDQLAVCTESLERKNQEWKDLVENVSTIYTNHHSLLKNLSRDLKRETEAQKQSMSAIKEGLSSTLSKTFGNLETEHTKLNSQIENLLHKFKVIDRSSAVKDKNYELVQDYESELCEVQKKNQELLLQCRSLEQHGTRWSKEAAKELKSRQAEYMNQLIIKKTDMMTLVVDDLSEAQVELNGIETDLKKEMQCKKEFTVWLEEFKDLHCDTTRLSDRVLGENRRIAGLIEHLTRRLKIIFQPKIKRDTVTYLKSLDADLEKKKKENKELLQKIQQIAPSVNSDILEEENVRLRETLKDVQAELKEKQHLVQSLENELSSAKADAKEKAEKALLLEEQLRSNTAESALSEMEVKMNEKEKHFQAALEEIQVLQEKVSKGAAPYKNEIERLRDQVVKGEMDRMKLTKSTEQQISSLKACVEDKEQRLRKLREQLRRSQKDLDDTVGPGSSSAPAYPLTCGGGSGIVQSTAMLVLQSKNAELKREIAQYKRKCHQLSSNISSYEEELKQLKKQSPKTPTTLLSSLHDDMMSHSNTDLCSATEVSPRKSEMSSCYITSPGKTGLQRKRDLSQSKTVTHKPPPMSPNRERHSVPASSPGNTDHYRKRPASPHKTDGPLFSTLTASPCKKQKLPVKTDSPKEKFFDVRSKSLPYWPDKFFDNSNLCTLSDLSTEPADGNPRGELDKALHAGATTETTSDVNNWWDKAPTDKPNECKAS